VVDQERRKGEKKKKRSGALKVRLSRESRGVIGDVEEGEARRPP